MERWRGMRVEWYISGVRIGVEEKWREAVRSSERLRGSI
jgi:hypothetical protein